MAQKQLPPGCVPTKSDRIHDAETVSLVTDALAKPEAVSLAISSA